MTTPAPDALLQRLRQGHRFLLTSHISPDGDAIGSALGAARILRSLGKSATVWLRDPVPTVYAQLPGAARIHVGTEPPAGFGESFDTFWVLECPTPERTGLESAVMSGLPVLNTDHHLGNSHYGTVNWIDTGSPACGELVLRIAQALKAALDEDAAACLYLALVSDTGGFRFSNATPQAFEAAATLVRLGAQPERISQWLYESQPEGAVRLLGAMLGTLKMHHAGKVATALLTPDMFRAAGASPGDSEGLVDSPRSIAGVDAVGLIRGLGNAQCKISLRSRGDIDVQSIAQRHGGGGHKNAAGCMIAGSEEEVREQVAAELGQVVGA
ncbi:MAG: bifunctional oligoribonuclease/PAP phosphatase NrnA [Acidobacteriota bacterium]